MKSIFGLIFLLVFSSPLFPGPESISEVDFSKARISIAGPNSLYMRGVEYKDSRYAAVITALDTDGESWQVTAVYKEEDNMAPPSTVLDLAEITPVGKDKLVISGIVVEDRSFAASFNIDRSGRLTLDTAPQPAEMLERYIDKLGSFKDLLMEAAEEKYAEQLRELEDDRMERLQRIAALEKEKNRLAEALEEAEAGRGPTDEEKAAQAVEKAAAEEAEEPVFTTTIMEGFIRTVPQLGSWEVTATEATQIETDQYFAKLLLPLSGQPKPTLYSFQTRSRGFGWAGTGMQILSAAESYGFNNSLLIWLTRDPDFYGTDKTRLQLFRSDKSVMMELVLDAVINEPLTEYLNIAILLEPMEEYITVSVNGIEKLKYKIWFGKDTKFKVALRALGGGVDFKGLRIMTTQ